MANSRRLTDRIAFIEKLSVIRRLSNNILAFLMIFCEKRKFPFLQLTEQKIFNVQ
jgi:hypothetical protein